MISVELVKVGSRHLVSTSVCMTD